MRHDDNRPRCSLCFTRTRSVDEKGVCRTCRRGQEELVPNLAERTRPADAAEIERRLAIIREAKGRHPQRQLTPREMDAVLEPLDCARTRARRGLGATPCS